MMKIHVICPFMRHYLLPTLLKYLEPMGIEFYPVVLEREKFKIDLKWVHPVVFSDTSEGGIGYKKINYFIETQPIIDEDYYCFIGDDDMYEPDFFNTIRQQTANLLFVSLFRGDSIPSDDPAQHPCFPLIISKIDDVRVCNIGFPQYIMKGNILKQMKLDHTQAWADGMFAEDLARNFPNEAVFLPKIFVYGNYFQPGRYTKNTENYRAPEVI